MIHKKMGHHVRPIYERDRANILKFLKDKGPQRPYVIGLACMPLKNKKGTHRQWANRWLLRLQKEDVIESVFDWDEITASNQWLYRIKE
jgi:hypothetical protein